MTLLTSSSQGGKPASTEPTAVQVGIIRRIAAGEFLIIHIDMKVAVWVTPGGLMMNWMTAGSMVNKGLIEPQLVMLGGRERSVAVLTEKGKTYV